MIHLIRLTVVGCMAAGWLSCKVNPTDQDLARSPEAAYAKLVEVGRASQAGALYDVLDIQTRWAVMSVFKDQKTMCALIQTHYPADRRADAARRCQAAQAAPDEKSFFRVLDREMGLSKTLARLGSIGTVKKGAERAEIESEAGKLVFCHEEKGWGYCGFLEQMERLKVRTARDLTSIQENAEAFKNR